MYGATYFEALFFVKCPQMIPAMYKQDSFSSKCGLPSGFYVVVVHTRRKISRFCLPSLPLTSIAASPTVIYYYDFHLETKTELLQLNRTQCPSLGIFVNKKVGNQKTKTTFIISVLKVVCQDVLVFFEIQLFY